MNNDLEQYRQSPAEFRQKIRRCLTVGYDWLSNGERGGEIGRVISGHFTRIQVKEHRRILQQGLASRVGRGMAILMIIGALTVLIRQQLGTEDSVLEIILDDMEAIALAAAGIIFVLESDDRKKRDQYEAWQVINSAMGQSGSGGRIQALEDLNEAGVDLEGVSAPKADLSGIQMLAGKLQRANFEGSQLDKSNLQQAELDDANLQEANLEKANLQGASLCRANLQGARLFRANLRGAFLRGANLQGSNLIGASLQGAFLVEANLQGAVLTNTDLRGANLQGANLQGTNLSSANLYRVQGASEEQISQARLCHTILPEGINLKKNRDCRGPISLPKGE